MNIIKKTDGEKITLCPEGILDANSTPQFETTMEVAICSTKDLVLDFEKVENITPECLRVLIKSQNDMKGKGTMVLIHVSDSVKEVFELTGCIESLNIQ